MKEYYHKLFETPEELTNWLNYNSTPKVKIEGLDSWTQRVPTTFSLNNVTSEPFINYVPCIFVLYSIEDSEEGVSHE